MSPITRNLTATNYLSKNLGSPEKFLVNPLIRGHSDCNVDDVAFYEEVYKDFPRSPSTRRRNSFQVLSARDPKATLAVLWRY